jgi:hypothetical protein
MFRCENRVEIFHAPCEWKKKVEMKRKFTEAELYSRLFGEESVEEKPSKKLSGIERLPAELLRHSLLYTGEPVGAPKHLNETSASLNQTMVNLYDKALKNKDCILLTEAGGACRFLDKRVMERLGKTKNSQSNPIVSICENYCLDYPEKWALPWLEDALLISSSPRHMTSFLSLNQRAFPVLMGRFELRFGDDNHDGFLIFSLPSLSLSQYNPDAKHLVHDLFHLKVDPTPKRIAQLIVNYIREFKNPTIEVTLQVNDLPDMQPPNKWVLGGHGISWPVSITRDTSRWLSPTIRVLLKR